VTIEKIQVGLSSIIEKETKNCANVSKMLQNLWRNWGVWLEGVRVIWFGLSKLSDGLCTDTRLAWQSLGYSTYRKGL